MLEEKVKKYGITRLAYELGLCELTIRNKIAGKSKITPAEMMAIQSLLSLTDEEVTIIREELANAQSEDTSVSV